jgi:TetR/AcrR family transcriptional regulator of autoinduction and epiphytic fitness
VTTTTPRRDGRAARGERTRDAVVEAFLTLTDEGHLRPTAKQISERAGVSLRSVFQHFADLETLFAAAADLQVERLTHLAVAIPPEAPFAERLSLFVAARSRLLETITPVRRSALLGEPFSPEIARRLRWFREMNRLETERVFATELAEFPPSQRRLIAAALHSCTDWFTWETLRVHSGLSIYEATKTMSLSICALLKKEAR